MHYGIRLSAPVVAAVLAVVAPPAGARAQTAGPPKPVVYRLVPAGEYRRGESDRAAINHDHPYSVKVKGNATWNEQPKHWVVLTKPFEIADREVTVAEFRAFVEATGYVTDAERNRNGAGFDPEGGVPPKWIEIDAKYTWRNPGFEQGDDHPVVCVSWNDAQAYCRWSSRDGRRYRLPTEAEWEFAARGGTQTWYSWGNDPDGAYRHANVADAALERAHPKTTFYQRAIGLDSDDHNDGFVHTAPVKSLAPNPGGLYDVHGNVWEWCQDVYEEDHYTKLVEPFPRQEREVARFTDPRGPETTAQQEHGNWRVLRGGGWYTGPISARSAVRAFAEAGDGLCYAGFRVVRDVVGEND